MIRIATALLFVSTLNWLGAGQISAATLPSGTLLVVKTLEVISSSEARGTKFKAQLLHSVSVQGGKALPAGTSMTGQVESSRRMLSHPERLTVSLIEATIAGKTVPIKTAAINLENFTNSRGVSFAHDYYQVAAGRNLKFQLAQPAQF